VTSSTVGPQPFHRSHRVLHSFSTPAREDVHSLSTIVARPSTGNPKAMHDRSTAFPRPIHIGLTDVWRRRFDIRSTGTHPTDFEMFVNYTSF
jgi:hypothetical protein